MRKKENISEHVTYTILMCRKKISQCRDNKELFDDIRISLVEYIISHHELYCFSVNYTSWLVTNYKNSVSGERDSRSGSLKQTNLAA